MVVDHRNRRHFVTSIFTTMSEFDVDYNNVGDAVLVVDVGPIDGPFLSLTKRQGTRLNDMGHSYYKDRGRGKVIYWRCSDKRCKGRVVQRAEVISRTQPHYHSPRRTFQEDIFIRRLGENEDESYEKMVVVPSEFPDEHSRGDNPTIEMNLPKSEFTEPASEWSTEEEGVGVELEEVDVKPDIMKLQSSLSRLKDAGVNTEPNALVTENLNLKMHVARLEMELQRYKDTINRIRADMDILNSR